jgi:hypothetical protein
MVRMALNPCYAAFRPSATQAFKKTNIFFMKCALVIGGQNGFNWGVSAATGPMGVKQGDRDPL